MTRPMQIFWGLTILLAIYLFASRPEPLAATDRQSTKVSIPIQRVFDTLDAINAEARTIYTVRIVGAGLQAGLKFGEDWAEPGQDKGPLPAIFLRLVAANLEAKPTPIGLYLGSDAPINKSNLFEGQEAIAFAGMKASMTPAHTLVSGIGAVGLYPDFASAAPCVTCHNDHPDSPKTDWKLGDVMGATTWTYPREVVDTKDYHAAINALLDATAEAYDAYLAKSQTFENPPEISRKWPNDSAAVLPDRTSFMAALRQAAAPHVLNGLFPVVSAK